MNAYKTRDLGDTPSLARAYARYFPIGAALEPETLEKQGPLVAHHFQRLTAENAMKFGEICKIAGSYDFPRADAIANFARAHAMPMTGHTLVWHRMTPPWLFDAGSSCVARSSVERHLREHILAMVDRYADVVDNWDVVNEAISDTPHKTWRDASEGSNWHTCFGGESYVALAFAAAGEAVQRYAPHIKLYYNDYDLEKSSKRQKTLAMIRALKREGVRVDGVGIQGHINLNWPSVTEFVRAIEEISAEGLLVKVSELDISIYPGDDPSRHVFESEAARTAELEQTLAARYLEVFSAFKQCASKLTSVTLWGVSDALSWLNTWPVRRKNYPLLFDAEYRPKAALLAVLGGAA